MTAVTRKLAKHTLIYAIGNALQAAIAFLLIPLYTRYLSAAEYGYLEIFNTFSSILLMLLSLGFASAILKTYHLDTTSAEDKRSLISTALIFITPVSAVILGIMLYFYFPLGKLLTNNSDIGHLLSITLISTFFIIFTNIAMSLLRAQDRSIRYATTFLIRFIVVIALNLYFVISLKKGLEGILIANLISYALIAITLIYDLHKFFTGYRFQKFSSKMLKALYSFGLPLVPASLAMWIMDISDRYMIQWMRSPEELGVYAFGYKFGFLISVILVTPFQLAWPSIYFNAGKDEKKAKELISKVLIYFLGLGTFVLIFIATFAKEISKYIGTENFYDGYKIIGIVGAAYILYGVHYVLAAGVHLGKKTKYYPLLIIFPAILNIILNILIIPKYGMLGAATTTIISFAAVVMGTAWLSQKFYKVKYSTAKIFVAFLLSLLAILSGLYLGFVLKALTLTLLVLITLKWLIPYRQFPEIKLFFKKN